jgi:hypothetical protein
MTDRELQLRLRAAAAALDADAPALDPAILRAADRRRTRRLLVAALAAVATVIAAPAAVSALGDLFQVDEVPELAADPGVAPPFLGRQEPRPLDEARSAVPYPLELIPSLGQPEAAYVREDVAGGMVSLAYRGGILLTQWPADRVDTRLAVVPVGGAAEDVVVGGRRGLWVAGAARGTFTLVGADGTTHREHFDVAAGALLWHEDGVSLLLQGAESKAAAVRLAADAAHG